MEKLNSKQWNRAVHELIKLREVGAKPGPSKSANLSGKVAVLIWVWIRKDREVRTRQQQLEELKDFIEKLQAEYYKHAIAMGVV